MIRNDFLYILSNSLVFSMFTKGLISFDEYKEIDGKNKLSFCRN